MSHIGNANKMVETPRMDWVAGHARGIVDAAILAEGIKLERELNRACEMYRKLDIHALNLTDRIKRLEEALTEIELAMKQPASNHRLMQISGPARQVINIIKKAKEAKL